ncbi:TPA: 1-phosphofructokinase [Enterococcus faecium]|uniref:1-phosphofructokinase n=1 Tax=Enterococcus TaxID=1350 RepID=UPI0007F3BF71|nr:MULTISPECIES: 1-phosphofructokinase [Enterococcus]HAQ1386371.1 1-phosphofructokinase [Enterococcus faecium Ef_aus0057]HAQ1398587.1 1-phosphofructokinase [Enterococcus faecium Ef_aus0071]HAQ1407459.1 1-phosphofructokinase [Enterococcus faecium Ef_aus0050]HAQ1410407.1 1-phosphofructokinase [Enterococcus faecium Ef_aus0030]HAQ1416065.1 1-phosphofructokinase [Enterococcus faecium Ef_aus0018]
MSIYTCTMNLAIDLFIETEEMHPFMVNRTKEDDIQANGKGVNVSLVLKMLDFPSTALGFSAGFTGKYIEDYLQKKQIQTEFIEVPGMTRINVFTQVNQTREEYKLVNQGPEIPQAAVHNFLNQIRALQAEDYLCVSGSLPRGMSPKVLVEISRICQEKEIHLIIDSSDQEVMGCLPYRPFLLKPNEEELSSWFGRKMVTDEDYFVYGQRLVESGAENVLLSLGEKGAILFTKDRVIRGNSPKGKVVNTACAGDAMLGTFLVGYMNRRPLDETLRKSIAAGSSTAFRKGLTDFLDVEELSKQIKIKEERFERWENIN